MSLLIPQVRTAQFDDFSTIARLHTTSWQTAYVGMLDETYLQHHASTERQAYWQDRFQNPPANQQVLMAEVAGEACGFVCAFWQDDPHFGTLIDNLHVLPAYKGQGIGIQLLRFIFREIEKRFSEEKSYLWVLRDNVAAQQFYEKCGAQKAELAWHEMPGGTQNATYRYF
jgi:ribosomal protein S18 acetylase RimI-like enzyme